MIYKHKFIEVQEVWFDDDRKLHANIDQVIYRQVKNASKSATKFTTLLIDLSEDKEKIFQFFKKNNKYEIKIKFICGL